jgi:hypothetical protein
MNETLRYTEERQGQELDKSLVRVRLVFCRNNKMNGQNDWIILHSSAARRVEHMDVWSAYFAQLCCPKGGDRRPPRMAEVSTTQEQLSYVGITK